MRAYAPIALALALATPARAEADAPADPARLTLAGEDADAVLARLVGLHVTVAPDRAWVRIDDVAGTGAPWIGVVARRDGALWLDTVAGSWRLAGPLARARIAGPGYTVWATGTFTSGDVPTLTIRRIGVLRRPVPTTP